MVLTDHLFLTNANSKIRYGLNDTIRVKEDMLINDPFIPSNMNFQTILMPKENLEKTLSEKSWSVRTILILSILYITLLFQCLLGGLDLTGGRYDSPEHHLYQTLLEEHLGDFRNSNAPSVPPEEGKVQFSL